MFCPRMSDSFLSLPPVKNDEPIISLCPRVQSCEVCQKKDSIHQLVFFFGHESYYWVWRMGFVPYGIKQKAWAPPWSIKGGGCLRGNSSFIPAVERRWAEGTFVLALV